MAILGTQHHPVTKKNDIHLVSLSTRTNLSPISSKIGNSIWPSPCAFLWTLNFLKANCLWPQWFRVAKFGCWLPSQHIQISSPYEVGRVYLLILYQRDYLEQPFIIYLVSGCSNLHYDQNCIDQYIKTMRSGECHIMNTFEPNLLNLKKRSFSQTVSKSFLMILHLYFDQTGKKITPPESMKFFYYYATFQLYNHC